MCASHFSDAKNVHSRRESEREREQERDMLNLCHMEEALNQHDFGISLAMLNTVRCIYSRISITLT